MRRVFINGERHKKKKRISPFSPRDSLAGETLSGTNSEFEISRVRARARKARQIYIFWTCDTWAVVTRRLMFAQFFCVTISRIFF